MKSNKIESTLSIVNITSAYHLTNFTCQLFQSNTSSMPSTRAVSSYTLNIAFKPIIQVALVNKALSKNQVLSLTTANVTLFNESDVSFKSQFTANPAQARTKWILDGVEQENINGNEFSWLKRTNRLTNAKRMLLTCQVENSAGVSETTYTLTVAYEPKILVPASSVTYDINELTQFQLTCQVSASPAADRVEWLYFSDRQSTSNNFKVASNTSLLQIQSVTHSLASGYFVCLATNKMTDSFGVTQLGKVLSRRVQLNVKFMPQMHLPFKKLAANLTKVTQMDQPFFRQNITCRSLANPAPEFTWYKDGMQLFQTDSKTKYVIRTVEVEGQNSLYESTLTINELGVLDMNRNYECEATNSLGSNRAKIELVPMSKPDQPTNLKSTFVNFMTTSLTWEAGFNGGIAQKFVLKLNDTSYSIDNSTCSEQSIHICVEKIESNQVNVHNLAFNSMYNIEVYALNSMGTSGSSNLIKVETNDLSESDAHLLPVFDTLFLNVLENRLEFTIAEKPTLPAHYCFQITTNKGAFNDCLPVPGLQARQEFNLDEQAAFDLQSISSMYVVTCFQIAPGICSMKPTRASIVNSYGQQHTNDLHASNIRTPSLLPSFEYSIPLALIIGIAVCIVTMLILLLLIVCYCIRRRSLKICKSLLTTTGSLSVSDKDSGSSQHRPLSGFSGSISEPEKKSHLNKTFNIDIGSISAPINSNLTASSASSDLNNSAGYGTGGSGLNVVNGSMTSSIDENQEDSQGTKSSQNQQRVPSFTAALSSTTSNLINNSIGRHKLNEILVIEDGEQRSKDDTKQTSLSKSSSTTGVSNCSSSNVQSNQQFYDFMGSFDNQNQVKGAAFIETQYNHNSSSSTGSNSDPIAINNSLSSANSSHADNSPTYGYNVTNATTTAMPKRETCYEDNDQDNLLYIRTGIDQKSFTMRSQQQQQQQDASQLPILRQNKSASNNSVPSSSGSSSSGTSSVNKHNSFHAGQYTTQESGQPESGYSTPSRLKKVVYEVIV